MHNDSELEALKIRFTTFVNKLRVKADELEVEVRDIAQQFYDEDEEEHKRSYHQFQAGIEGQFKHIIKKVEKVFESQIMPLRDKSANTDISEWYSSVYGVKNKFEKEIYAKMKDIFDSVEKISSEVTLQQVLDEYEESKNVFQCSQCGAALEINQLYFVSTYILCPYCQTQNTFIPGSRTQSLQFLAREVAEDRLRFLKVKFERLSNKSSDKVTISKAYNYYRARVWAEKTCLVPILGEEYAKIYNREIHEYLSQYSTRKISEKPVIYNTIMNQFGFVEEMKSRILEAHQQNDEVLLMSILIEWVRLYQLSAFIIPKLYQGKELEKEYNKNFKRVNEEWTILADLHKKLKAKEIKSEEVIKEIKSNF